MRGKFQEVWNYFRLIYWQNIWDEFEVTSFLKYVSKNLLHLGLVSSNGIAWNTSRDCPLSGLIRCFDGSHVSVQRHDVIGIKLFRTYLFHVEYCWMSENYISIALYFCMELAWKPKRRQPYGTQNGSVCNIFLPDFSW